MKELAAIFDLDGTLSNFDHRKSFFNLKRWNIFYSLLHKDTVNNWCRFLMAASSYGGVKILIVTARPEIYRTRTMQWLKENNIYYDELFMVSSQDHSIKNSDSKKDLYLSKIKDNFDILFCVEDRSEVVEMWRKLGVTCLQCAEGLY